MKYSNSRSRDIQLLSTERKDVLDESNAKGDDGFDIAVEDAISGRPQKRPNTGKKMSRNGRDAKFGFGGGFDAANIFNAFKSDMAQ